MRSIELLGTPLSVTTYDELTTFCQALAKESQTRAIDLSNTQIVTMRRHDRHFREITSDFDFFIPDGMPLIWCLNAKGAKLRDRVYGPTLMRTCILRSPAPFTHYLLGGSSETLRLLQERLKAQQPGLLIVGSNNGYFKSDDNERIVDQINQLSPDFIWVGLGTPKQQVWIHENKTRIKRGVILAVGFAFDVNAGTKSDAPAWMQRVGLTWVFRIASEPRRLLTRYLKWNTLFLFYLVRNAIMPRARHPDSA